MNPYQRIIRDGVVVQKGHIDTQAKFAQLTQGVDFQNKTVLDVGCNIGEMCSLAKAAGARFVRGIDCEPEFVYTARTLQPGCYFDVMAAERATGAYDVVMASAMLHYIPDLNGILRQFARLGKIVCCDVWMDEFAHSKLGMFFDEDRKLFYPTWAMWEELCRYHFGKVQNLGYALSPDSSVRYLYQLSSPKPTQTIAYLFYGTGGTGKTSRARDLKNGKNFEHLEFDTIFLEWRINVDKNGSLSAMDFVDGVWKSNDQELIAKYLEFYRKYIDRWVSSKTGLDIAIEGYDAYYMQFRQMLRQVMAQNNRADYREIECLPLKK